MPSKGAFLRAPKVVETSGSRAFCLKTPKFSSHECRRVIPKSLVETIPPASLPRNWAESPAPVETQVLGDAWIRSRASAVLRIPSAVFQGVPEGIPETNYLLNPSHPDFAYIEVGPFQSLRLDPRLTL